jgi:hypothetical protein
MDVDSVHDHVKKKACTTIVPSSDLIKVNERFCTDETMAMGISAFTCSQTLMYLPKYWGILFMTEAGMMGCR